MSDRPAPTTQPRVSGVQRAWHVVFTLVVGLGVIPWLFTAWFLWALRCDENCGTGDYDRWQYTGQGVLAGVGAVLAISAVVLGFTSARRAYWSTALMATSFALVWVTWILSGTF